MTYDPCAHVNGLAKPTYVSHKVLGRLRPRKHYAVVHHAAPVVKPTLPDGCTKQVIAKKGFFTKPAALKYASLLALGGLTGGPNPVYPTTPTTPVIPPGTPPVVTPNPPPVAVSEPASLFLLLAGVMVLMAFRRHFGPGRNANAA